MLTRLDAPITPITPITRAWAASARRALLLGLLTGVAWGVTAAPAAAGLFDYTATLDLDIGSTQAFRLDASGQLSVNPDGSFTFPAGVFSTIRTLFPPQTSEEVVASFELDMANGTGSFGGAGSPGGIMRLTGTAILNLNLGFGSTSIGISALGGTGTSTATASNGQTVATASILGASWQTGQFRQSGTTPGGSEFSTRTNTGVDQRTENGEGIVMLVMPAFFRTRVEGSLFETSPITGVLTITFVPEPAPLIGHTAMIVALTALGARRLRKRREGAP